MAMKVSIIMPVFNGEISLKQSIESVLSQSFHDFEFIIIDDGSTDKTWDILNDYRASDDRIRLIKNHTNKGIVYSLNRGLQVASNNLIARMDCGDICSEVRLIEEYEYLNEKDSLILVTTQAYIINSLGRIISETKYCCDDYSIKKDLYTMKCNIIHPAVLFRWDGSLFYRDFAFLAEDYDLWLRMAVHGEFARINVPLIKIRDDGISFNNRVAQAKVAKVIRKLCIERLIDKEESEKTINKAVRMRSRIMHGKKSKRQKLFEEMAKRGFKYRKNSIPWAFYMVLANLFAPTLIVQKISKIFISFRIAINLDPYFNIFLKYERKVK